jgi:hypothetical protein
MKPLPVELILTDKQLMALGQITAQWAFLESEIAQHTELTARVHKVPVPKDISSSSFERRIKAWRELVRSINIDGATRDAIVKLNCRVADMQRERHRTIHARWGKDNADTSDTVTGFGDRKPNVFEWRLSTMKLNRIARKISQLNADLSALAIPLPSGEDHP